MQKRVFYIEIRNQVDRRDDDYYKVRANSKEDARKWAEIHKGGNTRTVGGVYSPAEFRENFPWWSKTLRSDKGIEV